MGVVVRKAAPGEFEATVELLIACGLPTADVTPEGFRHFLVAEQAPSALEGVVGLEPYGTVGLLRSLAVKPSARGNGIARALLQALEDGAHSLGIEQLFLLTTDAERYFEHQGYAFVDRADVPDSIRATREFADLCPDSAHVMQKRVGA